MILTSVKLRTSEARAQKHEEKHENLCQNDAMFYAPFWIYERVIFSFRKNIYASRSRQSKLIDNTFMLKNTI